MKFAFHELTKN